MRWRGGWGWGGYGYRAYRLWGAYYGYGYYPPVYGYYYRPNGLLLGWLRLGPSALAQALVTFGRD